MSMSHEEGGRCPLKFSRLGLSVIQFYTNICTMSVLMQKKMLILNKWVFGRASRVNGNSTFMLKGQ
jgi:hypothetical protein